MPRSLTPPYHLRKKTIVEKHGADKKTIAKKPSAAPPTLGIDGTPSLDDVFETAAKAVKDGVSREAFGCRAYGAAGTRGKRAGMPTEQLAEFKKTQRAKAVVLYDEQS